jgi:hypothetical protein
MADYSSGINKIPAAAQFNPDADQLDPILKHNKPIALT